MKKETIKYNGLMYKLPKVRVLANTDLAVAEIAARTAYDSFGHSEHMDIRDGNLPDEPIDASEILDKLSWVHQHHSVLEHVSITFEIKGMSRGVLQEFARHRIGVSPTVRSTRYTMSDILKAFIFAINTCDNELAKSIFGKIMSRLNITVIADDSYNTLMYDDMFCKLLYHAHLLTMDEFINLALSKEAIAFVDTLNKDEKTDAECSELFDKMLMCKDKKNAGDSFKHIVSDMWATDDVVTMNLRSLKHFLSLRATGSAWFLMRALAEEMIDATDIKYLRLISKEHRHK